MMGPTVLPLDQLSGSTVSGAIQVAESALNDLLTRAAGARAPSVQLWPDNRLFVRYGVFHAQVLLPRAVELRPSPRITFTLASLVAALGLKAIVRVPFIEIRGRDVTIDLAAVPALVPWRALFRHLDAVELASERGLLRVRVALAIRE